MNAKEKNVRLIAPKPDDFDFGHNWPCPSPIEDFCYAIYSHIDNDVFTISYDGSAQVQDIEFFIGFVGLTLFEVGLKICVNWWGGGVCHPLPPSKHPKSL